MTNHSSLTSSMKANLAAAMEQEAQKNPDKAMQQLSGWHNLLGKTRETQNDRFFLETLASPIVQSIVARNTARDTSDLATLVVWEENTYPLHISKGNKKSLKNIADIMDAYHTLAKPSEPGDARRSLEWNYNYHTSKTADDATLLNIVQGADAVVTACIMIGTEDSLVEAHKLLNWQTSHIEENQQEQVRVVNNADLVVDACIQLGTPKSHAAANKVLDWQYDHLAAAHAERQKVIERKKELSMECVDSVSASMERFLNNFAAMNAVSQEPRKLAQPVLQP